MRRIAILAVATVLLLAAVSPALAAVRDDFYPGDAPPWATPNSPAGAGQGGAAANAVAALGVSGGTVTDSPAGLPTFPGNGYDAGPKGK